MSDSKNTSIIVGGEDVLNRNIGNDDSDSSEATLLK